MADLEIKITNSNSGTGGSGGGAANSSSEQILNQFVSIMQNVSRSIETASIRLEEVATNLKTGGNASMSEEFMRNTADHINAQAAAATTGEAVASGMRSGGGNRYDNTDITPRNEGTQRTSSGGRFLTDLAAGFGGYKMIQDASRGMDAYIAHRNIIAGSDYTDPTNLSNQLLSNEFEQRKSLLQVGAGAVGGALGFMLGGPMGGGIGAGIGSSAAGFGYSYLAGPELANQQKQNTYDLRTRELTNYGYSGSGAADLMQSGINARNPLDVLNMGQYSQLQSGFAKYGYTSPNDLQSIATSARTYGGISDINKYTQDITQLSSASGISNQDLIKMMQDAQSMSGMRQDELASITRNLVQSGNMSATNALRTASTTNMYGEAFQNQQQQFLTSSPLNQFKMNMISQGLYGFEMSDVYSGDKQAIQKYRNVVNQAYNGDPGAMAFTQIAGYAMPDMYGANQGKFGTSSYSGNVAGEDITLDRLKLAQQQVENADRRAIGYKMKKVNGQWQEVTDSHGNKIPEAYGDYQITLPTAKKYDPQVSVEKLLDPKYNEMMRDKIMTDNRKEAYSKGLQGTQAELYALAEYNGGPKAAAQFMKTGHSEYTDKILSRGAQAAAAGANRPLLPPRLVEDLTRELRNLTDTLKRGNR